MDTTETKQLCWICQRELKPGESCTCAECDALYLTPPVPVTLPLADDEDEARDYADMVTDLRHGG